MVRVHDRDWHRVSYARDMRYEYPVVISQVQTYDNRTQFVSTRQYFPPKSIRAYSYFGVSAQMTWSDARDYCRAHFDDLASIHSDEENEAVLQACLSNAPVDGKYCWIGYNDIAEEGQWVWPSGTVAEFTFWDTAMEEPYPGQCGHLLCVHGVSSLF